MQIGACAVVSVLDEQFRICRVPALPLTAPVHGTVYTLIFQTDQPVQVLDSIACVLK